MSLLVMVDCLAKKTAVSNNVPVASGVSHANNTFTPVSVSPKQGLKAQNLALLRTLKLQEVVKERSSQMIMTGCDNVTGALAGTGKRLPRRLSLLRKDLAAMQHTNVLAVTGYSAFWLVFYTRGSLSLEAARHRSFCTGKPRLLDKAPSQHAPLQS